MILRSHLRHYIFWLAKPTWSSPQQWQWWRGDGQPVQPTIQTSKPQVEQILEALEKWILEFREVGDIVHDDNQPKSFWKLAQVESTITGRDGKRSCSSSCSQGQPTMLHCPIQCLHPLEVHEKTELQPNLPEYNPDKNSDGDSEWLSNDWNKL